MAGKRSTMDSDAALAGLATSAAYALLVLVIATDALAALVIAAASGGTRYPFRVSRVLRPLLLPYLSKTIEHMVAP